MARFSIVLSRARHNLIGSAAAVLAAQLLQGCQNPWQGPHGPCAACGCNADTANRVSRKWSEQQVRQTITQSQVSDQTVSIPESKPSAAPASGGGHFALNTPGPSPPAAWYKWNPPAQTVEVDVAVSQALRTMKEGRLLPQHFKLIARREADSWSVEFQHVPYGPGLETTVMLYDDGRVRILGGM